MGVSEGVSGGEITRLVADPVSERRHSACAAVHATAAVARFWGDWWWCGFGLQCYDKQAAHACVQAPVC